MPTRQVILGLVPMAMVLVFHAVTAGAASFTWDNASGGDYATGGNWAPSGPPGSGDTAILDGTPSGNITLSESATNDTLQVSAGSGPITFDLAGHRLELMNYEAVAPYTNWAFCLMTNSTLTVTNSSTGGALDGLGSDEPDSTSLFIDDGAVLTCAGENTSVSQLQARVAAGGLWQIKGGADVTLGSDPVRGISWYFGNDPDEPALIVDGAGSTYWDVKRYICNCSMVITNGGYAYGYRDSYVGDSGSTGKVLITGTGSEWAGYSPYVNANSACYVTVTNGGLLNAGASISLVDNSYAQFLITGEGSELNNSAYLQICRNRSTGATYNNCTGLLWVVDGGYVNQRFLSMGPGGVLRLDDGEVQFHWNNWDRRSIMAGGGLVEGKGKIWNSAASDKWFHNDGGVVRPGLSGGTLIFDGFDGGFTNGPGAELEIEIGGTNAGEFGRLVLTNCNVHFGGTLRVTLINGYKPAQGARFDILDFPSVDGTFETLDLPDDVKRWDLHNLYVTGEIRYLVPGTIVFIQ